MCAKSRLIEFSITPYVPFREPRAVIYVEHVGRGLLHYEHQSWDWEAWYW